MVRGKPGAWDPNTCLSFAEKLLRFIRATLEADNRENSEDTATEEGESTGVEGNDKNIQARPAVWRLSIRPNGQYVTLKRLEPEEIETVRNGEDRVGFLPTWFWNSVMGVQE
jgi:RAT1-interacting protein